MARKTVSTIVATDDITGGEFKFTSDDTAMVNGYQVTITPLDENGNVKTDEKGKNVKGTVYTVDMHDNTYNALTALLSGSMLEMLRLLLSFILGISKSDAITAYAIDQNDGTNGAVLGAFGGTTPKATGSNPYTGYVRAYAISKGWTGANGNKIADKGKMSQDVVIKFVTETGITVERFNAGDRIPE